MATIHHIGGGAPALPLNLLAQAVPMLTRNELAALAERLLDRLDEIDGDPEKEEDSDTEANGDECDTALPEWDGGEEQPATTTAHTSTGTPYLIHEDDEDDDPAGQCDEDGLNTCSGAFIMHGLRLNGPGCAISEDGI